VEREDAQKLGEVKGTFKGNTSTSNDEIFHGSIQENYEDDVRKYASPVPKCHNHLLR